VKTSVRPSVSRASSSISTSRRSLPERPSSPDPSAANCAGWLHTCLSRRSVAGRARAGPCPPPRRAALSRSEHGGVERGCLSSRAVGLHAILSECPR
jgi:hypothetical protein